MEKRVPNITIARTIGQVSVIGTAHYPKCLFLQVIHERDLGNKGGSLACKIEGKQDK
jgi:hypothetical protein